MNRVALRLGDLRHWRGAIVALQMVLLALLLALVVVRNLLSPGVSLEVGQVVDEDILAPRELVYTSGLATRAARAEAEAGVTEVYDPPDPRIARQRVTRAGQVLNYLRAVRADPYPPFIEKRRLLEAVPDLDLEREALGRLLRLPDDAWRQVSEETLYVLNQVMRQEIRESGLVPVRDNLPTVISPALADEEAALAAGLAAQFVVPNSFYSAEITQERRNEAARGVEPVVITLSKGEAILRAGDLVEARDLEALEALGLLSTGVAWQDLGGPVLFALLTVAMLALYLYRFRPRMLESMRSLALYNGLLVLFALGGSLVANDYPLAYFFPAAALAVLVAGFFDAQLALLTSFLMGLLMGYAGGVSLELAVYVLAGSLVGALSLWRVERLQGLFWSGAYVALTNMLVVLAFQLPAAADDPALLVAPVAGGLFNGVLTASLAVSGFFVLGNLFGITTTLQLVELARPTHPLLRQLLLKTPGTYHHSIIVANMGEQAAQQIQADPLLVRVAAYYHDIGKTVRPYFFIENQMDGVNVHDRLDPYTSAQMLIAHVKDGLELARKYKLPEAVARFIPEHQGTGLVKFFYVKAVEQAGQEPVDETKFRYGGPKPQSREAAILMLADGVESTCRANRPATSEETDKIIRRTFEDRLKEGQLDECDLTLRDLEQIRDAFAQILQGIWHHRVRYPEMPAAASAIVEPKPPLLLESKPGRAKKVAPASSSQTHREAGGPRLL